MNQSKLQMQQQADLSNSFEAAFKAVGGKFYRARGLAYACEQIGIIAATAKAKTAALWDTPFLRQTNLDQSLARNGVEIFWADSNVSDAPTRKSFREKILTADLGITQADFALADTGTLVLLARPGQPRSASLLPPRHIALIRPTDLVADLDELFAALKARGPNLQETLTSAMTFITGPSRTADIEQLLFIGVHGPLEVHAVYLETL